MNISKKQILKLFFSILEDQQQRAEWQKLGFKLLNLRIEALERLIEKFGNGSTAEEIRGIAEKLNLGKRGEDFKTSIKRGDHLVDQFDATLADLKKMIENLED